MSLFPDQFSEVFSLRIDPYVQSPQFNELRKHLTNGEHIEVVKSFLHDVGNVRISIPMKEKIKLLICRFRVNMHH